MAWNGFLKSQKGKGYSMKELSEIYQRGGASSSREILRISRAGANRLAFFGRDRVPLFTVRMAHGLENSILDEDDPDEVIELGSTTADDRVVILMVEGNYIQVGFEEDGDHLIFVMHNQNILDVLRELFLP